MISVVVYGRNDSHGYNLAKRAALSLNCIAEVLTDSNDEILFVDYNTPLSHPNFIETIHDTLTAKAKKLIKVIRVPPSIHERFKGKTHLVVNEPLSRNIAIRRSNPSNRWILSTNTDMIFVSRVDGKSLSDIAADLEDGFYELPRFEVPESLWECLDRKEGSKNIHLLKDWGINLHLNMVAHMDQYNLFNAPGDFQLILRNQAFQLAGFDERMILGWHLDSNIAKRLHLLNRKTKSVLDHVFGYHCRHTRTEALLHKRDQVQNDLSIFYNNVNTPFIPDQEKIWGLPEEEFETYDFSEKSVNLYLTSLKESIQKNTMKGTYYEYFVKDFRRYTYPCAYKIPYVSSCLATLPKKDTTIGYFGLNQKIKDHLNCFLEEYGFERNLLTATKLLGSKNIANENQEIVTIYDQSSVLIFDFGLDDQDVDGNPSNIIHILKSLEYCAKRECNCIKADKSYKPKKIIVINGMWNIFSQYLQTFLNVNFEFLCDLTFSTKISENAFSKKNKKIRNQEFDVLSSAFLSTKYKDEVYNLGSKLIYRSKNNNVYSVLDSGWEFPTQKGTWTKGKSASFELFFDESINSDIKLNALIKPFVRKWHPHQKITLTVNGNRIKTWEYNHRWYNLKKLVTAKRISVIIPKKFINKAKTQFLFEIEKPASNDKGFRFSEITIS